MRALDRRTSNDRRKHPTDGLSRFSFRGRRRSFRREKDRGKGGYVDRYGPGLLFFLILILGLSLLDAILTMMILEGGGWEVNPVVRAAIQLYGDKFWIWKFLTVSVPLILLCLHSKFRMVMPVLYGISALYVAVVLFQVLLILY